ncbi:MAG: response regulator [Desulfobacteraceae bacterium]|nr:response regulator [Desulfobacteraceae bacterium]
MVEKSLKGSETILLVDDEEFIRNSGKELLTRFGYAILTAADGEIALDICREKPGEIDLVIMDLLMPGMGGKKCLKEILLINPLAKIVLASGYSPDGMASEAADIGAKGFIGKPYQVNELLTLIREVLDH